jgi:hypothetical protein
MYFAFVVHGDHRYPGGKTAQRLAKFILGNTHRKAGAAIVLVEILNEAGLARPVL